MLTISGTRLTTEHDALETIASGGTAETVHSQRIALGEARLRAEYALTDRTGISALVPVRLVDTSIRYLDAATRAEVRLAEPEIHHRNERLVAVVDPWLLFRASGTLGPIEVDARAGVTAPLAGTEDDPFALGDLGLAHQHIQFGTGTWNPVVGVEARYRFARWGLAAYALTQQVLYENGKGYQAGDRYAAALLATSPLGTKDFSFSLGPEGQAESAERWHGAIRTDEGNQGRIDLLAAGSVGWRLTEDLAVTGTVRARLFTHVVGGQLTYPAVFEVGLSKTFGGR